MFESLRQFPLYSKTEPPTVLKEHFKDDTFKKSQAYGKDKAKFSLCSGLFRQALDSALLHCGVYAWSWDLAGSICLVVGYGPEHEVSPVVRLSRMLLICPATADHPVALLCCHFVLRLLCPKYPALRLSNIRSRGKARVQQNDTGAVRHRYHQRLVGRICARWAFPCRLFENL